jgi:integrase/recombinase XerD
MTRLLTPRTVFLGNRSRKAVRSYLKLRKDGSPALWISESGNRLTYSGLRGIVRRRAILAGLEEPSLHSFRRAFAINMLRAGVDIYSLQNLMGHADLQVLRRYLKQTSDDLQAAHHKGSPVDREL